MIHALRAFLDFCYLARCDVLDTQSLAAMQDALDRFHQYREIFRTCGVCSSFNLPHQHSLTHFIQMIQAFGTPNGLCSSITELKHIKAVKKPYRWSSHYQALGQMLLTNQRLDKLAVARVDFQRCGMLNGTCLSYALRLIQDWVSFIAYSNLYHLTNLFYYIAQDPNEGDDEDEDEAIGGDRGGENNDEDHDNNDDDDNDSNDEDGDVYLAKTIGIYICEPLNFSLLILLSCRSESISIGR